MTAPGTVPVALLRAYVQEVKRLHELLDILGVPAVEGQVASDRLEVFVRSYRGAKSLIKKASGK